MIRRYWRFAVFLAAAGLFTALCWSKYGASSAVLIGFDIGAALFLATLISLVRGATAATMRRRSQTNEPDHHWLLALSLAIAAITLVAVGTELAALSRATTAEKHAMIALATVSLAVVWLFANALGAIHYAHLWYLPGADGGDMRGLDFPGPDLAPDYLDFAYFAVVLSMTFQISDVTTGSKAIRRLVLVHSLVAFVFNITVIALSVSLVTSALGQ